ncbi:UNVERIFIED_CONTAM: hypothetical protein GTU68_006785 [Idotea baltica]|nr:hypothetical protein [Idotea baltica]
MGVNKVILVGRLGQDPEVKMTGEQKQIVNFSLATGERRKDQQGNWVDHTEWHRVVCFGKLAELASSYLGKGREVYLEGKIKTNKWKDKEGNTRYSTDIIANSIEFLGNKNDASANMGGGQQSNNNFQPADQQKVEQVMASLQSADSVAGKANEVPFEDDDIPF